MDQPLLPHLITTTTEQQQEEAHVDLRVLTRISLVFALAMVSIWANYEASKGFEIKVMNMATDTELGCQYNLMFVSNGRAERMVLNASEFIESVLYQDASFQRKRVSSVTILMSEDHTLMNNNVSVSLSHEGNGYSDFVIRLSAGIMAETDNKHAAMAMAVHWGMAQVWLFNEPEFLREDMVQCLSLLAGYATDDKFNCLKFRGQGSWQT
ncbi:hypothetical protein J5N97_027738 [Dioscorea zingiberensis]|uniref:Uncharacterized protein n=1 Tax=Dioscorea zingiberensis TaxID=325984 RepID=A0A9D5BXF4_9LILI|nr:hypothetical protein J5N97_027738 [Dioscorea zingiberensis]